MAKNRVNKNEKRRLQMKAKHAQGVEISTRIRLMAEQIQNNAQLRTLLMQEPDMDRRKHLFNFMLPFLKFEKPEFPSLIEPSRIILP